MRGHRSPGRCDGYANRRRVRAPDAAHKPGTDRPPAWSRGPRPPRQRGALSTYGRQGADDSALTAVRAIYEAFARQDVEAALEHVAEDVELLPSGTAGRLARTEPYRGHAGVREYFADAARVWDDITLHAEDIRAVAGSVVVFGRVEATRQGQAVSRRVLWSWKVRDGLAYAVHVNDLGDAPPG